MMIGIFAAMMSTATSVLLVVGQAVGRDFYSKTINKNATAEQEVRVTKNCSCCSCIYLLCI